MKTKAIYAGTFDPMTYGHLDIIERSAELFDEVIVAIAIATPKQVFFPIEERVAMAKQVTAKIKNVRVESFDNMLVNFARKVGARILIRGLRAYSDFEYEFQMALTNRKLAPEIETLFLMPREMHSYVSSSSVKEVARLGGDISGFVPPEIRKFIVGKLKADCEIKGN